MGISKTLLIVLMVTAALVAGCFADEEEKPVRSFEASGGQASDGYAYNGTGLENAAARLSGWVDHETNTGNVSVSFEFAGSQWQVYHDSFSGDEEWKEGGVAFGLVEHGDTGVSSTIIPRLDGEIVTYGSATVLRDGVPAPDPGGADGRWDAHLMLFTDAIRGDDGMITKEDGSTPYDPDTPDDARIIDDDPQGFLQLTAPSGPDSARADETVSETVQVQGVDDAHTVELGGGPSASITVNVTTAEEEPPLQAGDIQVRLVDAQQNVLDEDSGDIGPNQGFETSLQAVGVNETLQLEVSGNGTYTLDIEAHITYDDHPFIILTWDDYELEEADEAPNGT